MDNEQATAVIEHLIGTTYVPTVKAYIAQLTGRARIVGPNDISSRDFDTQRIHIHADAQGVITGFRFA